MSQNTNDNHRITKRYKIREMPIIIAWDWLESFQFLAYSFIVSLNLTDANVN